MAASPIERIELRNRHELLEVLQPGLPPGLRLRVVWEGSEYRGRGARDGMAGQHRGDRQSAGPISGRSTSSTSTIASTPMTPTLHFQGVTTGGFQAMEARLASHSGSLVIDTNLVQASIALRDLLAGEVTWEAGGLGRRMRAFLLPDDAPGTMRFERDDRRCMRRRATTPSTCVPPSRMGVCCGPARSICCAKHEPRSLASSRTSGESVTGVCRIGLGRRAALLLATPALAQAWPTRPIAMIAPLAAGSSVDIMARLLAEQWSTRLGVPVPVENRPAANGTVALGQAARAAPDGYTVALTGQTSVAFNPHLYAALPYDPFRDFAYIARIAGVSNALVVRTASPFRTLPNLLAAARGAPGTLTLFLRRRRHHASPLLRPAGAAGGGGAGACALSRCAAGHTGGADGRDRPGLLQHHHAVDGHPRRRAASAGGDLGRPLGLPARSADDAGAGLPRLRTDDMVRGRHPGRGAGSRSWRGCAP